jgi:hypothetical protein
MFTGTLPFPSDSAQESMIMRLTDEPKTLQEMKPDVVWSPQVHAVMQRALQRKAADRYQRASDFGNALSDAVAHMPKNAVAEMGTMMIGAAATAVMAPPPPTRVDASVQPPSFNPTAPSMPAPVAPSVSLPSSPVVIAGKSKTPMVAGVSVGVLALAAAGFMMMTKKDDGTAALKSDSSLVAPSTTASAPAGGASGLDSTRQTQAPVTEKFSVPATSVPNSAAPRPNGGAAQPSNSAPAASYAAELNALSETVNDEASGKVALRRVADYESKVTTASDKTLLAFIEAKATLWAVGAEKGCRMLRIVRREQLSSGMRTELDDALKECGSP